MNPSENQSPGLHLPPPAGPATQVSDQHQPMRTAAVSVQSDQAIDDAQSVASQQVEHSDDDGALIDAEWIERARDIVSRYHTDPSQQSKELSKVKASYLKARYNKDIKVTDA